VPRLGVRRLLPGLITLSLLVVGLLGAYSYGKNYYLHRGFAPIPRLPQARPGRLLEAHFFSPALRRRADYFAYLPPGYTRSNRYPVLYLLHGSPGQPKVFIDVAHMDARLDNLISLGRARPMILVFPDGRIKGSDYSDSEWANTHYGAHESYVLDVMRNVDRRFSTLRHRDDRVIGGISAGAYGAINIALHHLGEFASAELWSGYFTQSARGAFANATPAELDYNSPLYYVTRLTRALAMHRLRVFMIVGRNDPDRRQIGPMATALASRGASVRYAYYRGGHDWQLWWPHLNQMLILASRDVGHPLGPLPARPAQRHRRRAVRRHHRGRFVLGTRSFPPVGRQNTGLASPRPHHRRSAHRRRLLVGALLLALASAAMINLGFLLQHRGLARLPSGTRNVVAAMLRSRVWLAGQVLGWIGFAAQILAVAIAPLSLVQAFAAGGLAISVPLASGIFGYSVSRAQLVAVLLISASLFSLPIALSSRGSHLHPEPLVWSAIAALLVASAVALTGRAALRAIAAGIFYGVADAAIKAESIHLRVHGTSALLSGWTVLAILATFGGFLAFQAALRADSAVTGISLMSALAALVALAFGVFGFGESLGRTPIATIVHLIAIAFVLACVPVLASAQTEMADVDQRADRASPSPEPLRPGYGTG
jgi:enterochelin esterase-like enzyme